MVKRVSGTEGVSFPHPQKKIISKELNRNVKLVTEATQNLKKARNEKSEASVSTHPPVKIAKKVGKAAAKTLS